jgi:glycosyltransferase involved in cell wall biosynthesis
MNAKTPHPLTASELLEISVVIPTHNSDKYISTTIEKTVLALRKLNLSFELIIVDDCSTDSTFQNCTELQVAYKELRIVRLVRNQGQRNATSVGYSLARSKYVVTFDDDLQYSPEEISLLHEKIQ